MDPNLVLIAIVFIGILFIMYRCQKSEGFDIPLRSSSAFDWNLGPGYGAGYGTGYAMWGMWPASLPKEPWKNWMWGRRPLIFTKPFTPAPQIDYLDAPESNNKPTSNYNISLIPSAGRNVLSVNGFPAPTLQLDRGRVYFFHVYTPGAAFSITDAAGNLLVNPTSNDTISVRFDEGDPDQLFYGDPKDSAMGGIIFLNSTR